jgi:heat shock transcription factor
MKLLLLYYLHCNLQGFRKIDPDRWEFANEGFLRGQRQLLKMIKRRRPLSYLPSSQQQALGSCLEVGQFGFEEEIEMLKRDKNALLTEVVKLRQEQQSTKADMRAMEERLHLVEQKQLQVMGFLARAMQNPDFFLQLIQQKDILKDLEDAYSKKRRRSIDIVPFLGPGEASQSEQLESTFLFDEKEFSEVNQPGYSELENLAMNIQGMRKGMRDDRGGRDQVSGETELTDDFWEELLSEGMRDEAAMPQLERRPRYVDT